ncbi:MAG: HDOD domain-containing protein [Pseudomonadota bacterium]
MAPGFYRDIDPADLPIPDRQVMQLIQYTLREDAEVDKLTQLISVNPTLTAQLLGMVNSAFFRFREDIKTISQAVVAIGMKSLRNLVLCFAVKEALSKKKIPGFDIDTFWEDSIRRAVAAKQLGYMVNGSIEEAFTAGMLQDIGLLVLFAMEPEKADRWPLLRANPPWQRQKMEEELFHTNHEEVGALLAKKWNLPMSYTRAIGHHHSFFNQKEMKAFGKAKGNTELSGMIHLADLCNAVYTCYDKSGVLTRLIKEAKLLFDLPKEKVESLLAILPEQVEETSAALNISVGKQIDFDSMMNQANQKLVEDNISYQELTWQLQNSLKQRDEYAGKLEAELDVAREIQKSLQPDIDLIHQVVAFNLPAYHLSGDFYDYFIKEDKTICFCLGDVSGKGTAAALLMAKTVSLFRCLCKVLDDIGQIVQLMNNELCETAVRGMFITFVGGWLDPKTQKINIVNVGHLPPFLVQGNKVIKIDAADPPLGVLPGILHPARQFSILNSRLYLFTDGFTEGRLKKGDKTILGTELGIKGFLRWLLFSGKMSLNDQMDWLKERCKSQLAPQSDDLTLMILSGESPPLP